MGRLPRFTRPDCRKETHHEAAVQVLGTRKAGTLLGPEEDLMIEHVWLVAILFLGGLLGTTLLPLAVGIIRNRWHRRQIADRHRPPLVIDTLGWSPPPLVEEKEGGEREVDLVQAMGAVQARALTTPGVSTMIEGEARVAATLDILRALEGEPPRVVATLDIPQALEGEPARDFTALHASIPAEGESPRRFKPTGLRSRIAAALQARVWSSMEVGFLDLEEVPGRRGRIWDPRKAS